MEALFVDPVDIDHHPSILRQTEYDNDIRWRLGQMLYDLLEAWCRAFEEDGKAGHVAIEADGVVMSYRALHEAVAARAAALTGLGISAADRIGLLLDRSIDCYCVMLAVVKLGTVYVPLDAKFPADRISYIAAIAARGQLRSGLCCPGDGGASAGRGLSCGRPGNRTGVDR